MKTILYTFADGHKEELEVTDEVAEVFYELEKYEQKVNRKETRRHVSLDMLEEAGFEFADPETTIEALWEKQELEEAEERRADREDRKLERQQKWLESRLTARQAQAYFKFKYFGMKKVDIAKEMGGNICKIQFAQSNGTIHRRTPPRVLRICQKAIHYDRRRIRRQSLDGNDGQTTKFLANDR